MQGRIHDLKSRVVRSLFHVYPPFQSRACSMAPFESDPDCLKATRCIRVWYQKTNQKWLFFLKYERTGAYHCPVFPSDSEWSPLSEKDVLHNHEENNAVLRVEPPTCSFVLIPDVVGQILVNTFVSVEAWDASSKTETHFYPVGFSKAFLWSGSF